MRTLINNADVVLPSGTQRVPVLLDHGVIRVDPGDVYADETVDAAGLHLLPGCIDDQVHFRDPGLTQKEDLHTGSVAAAKGGVTTFIEMPNTNPTTTDQAALDSKYADAATKCVTNFGFYIGATPDNVDVLKSVRGAAGIKIFIGSSTGSLLVDEQDALERIFAETTLPICAHCEDESTVRANAAAIEHPTVHDHSRIRDEKAAVIATKRALDLAHRHKHRFHVLHVSTAAEVPIIAEAINSGEGLITAEVCPHHLLFNVDDYDRLGSLVQMNPSVKTADDNAGLWKALADGTIQVIATDHAPHRLDEKEHPYPASPSGLPAVENMLALMLDAVNQDKLTIEQLADRMADAPARVWDIVGKGRIADGYDADVVLVDLNAEHTIRNEEQLTKSGWSPWDGVTLRGLPVKTWVGGTLVFSDGRVDVNHRARRAEFDHDRGGYWAT
ncbi:MAG: dihydroorotase [Planctomycetota bacterium]